VLATEASNASRTLLFDIRALAWSDELGEAFGVPLRSLPEVRPSAGRFGVTATGASPLPGGVALSGVAGDQQAALFGQACFRAGMTKNTYGTGSFVLMNVGDACPEPVAGLLTTVAWSLRPGSATYALEGAIFATGAAIQWLRDGLGVIEEAPDVGPLADSVPDSGGVVVVPAFAGLGSPWWDPYARGAVLGLTRGSTAGHVARATVEAIAFQVRDVIDAMTAASGQPLAALRVDGGASALDLLLRLQADQIGVAVERCALAETTALGAAWLAGIGAGVWSSLDELAERWASDAVVVPGPERANADATHRRWLAAVERVRDWERPDPAGG
jgi:glycerol kinase